MRLDRDDLPSGALAPTFPPVWTAAHLRVETPAGAVELDLPEGAREFFAETIAAAAVGVVTAFPLEETVKPHEAAAALGVSRPMIYKWIDAGLLEDRQVGSAHRVTVSSVEKLLEAHAAAWETTKASMAGEGDQAQHAAARARVRARRVARG